jgi:CBS domain containing-hemolysin-like protein
MIAALVGSVLLLVANGAFVAYEFALVGSRQSLLEPMVGDGRRGAQLGLDAMRHLNLQLAGAQLGITLASLTLGYVAEPLVVGLVESGLGVVSVPEVVRHSIAFVLGLGVVVFLHMVVGEMVPKNLAITHPERTLLALVHPARLYLGVFRPLVAALTSVANALLRLLQITPRDQLAAVSSSEDLAQMLAESHRQGLIEGDAHRLLTGVLEFGRRTVGSVMVPRHQIVWVSARATAAEAEGLAARSGHSRLPVLDDDTGEPLGFVHGKDLLALSEAAGPRPLPLRLVRRMPVVPVDGPLEKLLADMRSSGVHVALVLDGTEAVGLVTLEDLLEELVGEIVDETDHESDHEADDETDDEADDETPSETPDGD